MEKQNLCLVRQSALGLCPRDFSQCPRGWTGDGGSCLPPIDYTGAPTAADNIKLWVLPMWCQVYVGSLICRAQVNQTLKLDRHQDISGCTLGVCFGNRISRGGHAPCTDKMVLLHTGRVNNFLQVRSRICLQNVCARPCSRPLP